MLWASGLQGSATDGGATRARAAVSFPGTERSGAIVGRTGRV